MDHVLEVGSIAEGGASLGGRDGVRTAEVSSVQRWQGEGGAGDCRSSSVRDNSRVQQGPPQRGTLATPQCVSDTRPSRRMCSLPCWLFTLLVPPLCIEPARHAFRLPPRRCYASKPRTRVHEPIDRSLTDNPRQEARVRIHGSKTSQSREDAVWLSASTMQYEIGENALCSHLL